MASKAVHERVGQFKDAEELIRARWQLLRPVLDERRVRLWSAAEAQAIGPGGVAVVARATGLGRERISAGIRELAEAPETPPEGPPQAQRIRRPGGGRKPITETDPTLERDLEALLEPSRRGDPESPLRWTTKSTRTLAAALAEQGHRVSPTKVGQVLADMGYSLQANKKTAEGKQHPDRDAQFRYISEKAAEFANRGSPVISTDTKKKELVGNFKNAGQEWRRAGDPRRVSCHDFPDRALGKAIPYGVYDIRRDVGWVNVGVDHDTPRFAVASIAAWWAAMGKKAYPDAKELLITADAGGSNSWRARNWKVELQQFADETGLTIQVSHFPPGTSKWNKIEHALFSAISLNWRGQPLTTYETIVNLIAATTTTTGLRVRARLDRKRYPTGVKVSNAEFRALTILRDDFHGEWNYAIVPRSGS